MKKIIFYLSLLIVFALPSYLVRFNISGVPTTLLEVLIYISFVLTLVSSIKNQELRIGSKYIILNSKYLIPIILFIIAGIIGVIVSPEKNVALGQFKAFIVDPLLFFYVIIANIKTKEDIKWLLKVLIAGGTLVAIHTIYQKFTGDLTIDGRVVGIFSYSPNYLSLYLAPIAVLTMGYEMLIVGNRWNDPQNIKKILPYDLAFSIIIIALYFSGSRAGLGVTIISISFLLVVKWWNQIRQSKVFTLLLYFFITLLLVAGWWFIKPNWQLSPEQGGRVTSSNNIRWEIWQTSGKMLTTNHNWLWGVGLGNYQNYFSNFTKGWVNYDEYISPNALTAHNLYLQTWFNLGLLGIVAFIWLIVLFFRYTLQAIRYTKNTQTLTTCYILLATMFSILLYGLIDTPYWKNDLAVMFWLILGLAFIVKKKELESKNK